MKFLFAVACSLLSSAAVFAAESPGRSAYAAVAKVSPALQENPVNVRRACLGFGEYLAYKACTTAENTDRWTLRNLGFAAEHEAVLREFCSGPQSSVSAKEAAQAAESIFSTFGYE